MEADMTRTDCEYTSLLEAARNEGATGREQLALRIQSDIRPYVFRMLYDHDLANDITQETLLKAFEKIHHSQESEHFRAWLYRTAKGKVQQHIRDKKRYEINSSDLIDNHEDARGTNGLTRLIHRELSEVTFMAMDALKVSHRHIIILRIYQKLSYNEIADVLGCSSFAAKTRFYKAKQQLKKKLKGGGFNKSMLVSALVIFGKLTAESSAATVVPIVTKSCLAASPLVIVVGSGVPLLIVSVAALLMALPGTAIIDSITNYFARRQYETVISVPEQVVSVQYSDKQGSGGKEFISLANRDSMAKHFERSGYRHLNVIIAPGESIEFAFAGHIANGPGDDIYITELGPAGESVEVYLFDNQNNELYLGLAQTPRIGRLKESEILNYPFICKFDLSGYDLEFQPVGIRLTAIATEGELSNFELQQLQARVEILRGNQDEAK